MKADDFVQLTNTKYDEVAAYMDGFTGHIENPVSTPDTRVSNAGFAVCSAYTIRMKKS